MSILFVFIPSQTGPQPQLWHDGAPKNGEGKERFQPLFKYALTELEEYGVSLGRLTLKHFEDRFRDKLVSDSERTV